MALVLVRAGRQGFPMTLPTDPTLDEMRATLAPVIPAHAAFDGWTDEALTRAAEELGLVPAQARLAFRAGRWR